MKRKSAKPEKPYDGPVHEVGTKVCVLQPSMWAGNVGVVTACGRNHVVRITHKESGHEWFVPFHVAAPFEQLKKL